MLDLLVALFYLPMQHLPESSRLLLKLATCFEVVGDLFLPDGFQAGPGSRFKPGLNPI